MPRFCASCGAQMADTAGVCPACGKAAAQSSGGGTAAAPAAVSAAGIDPKLGGLLCYLPVGPVPLIADIFFLVAEPYKYDKFLRFHAFQSLFTGVAAIVLWIAIAIVGVILGAIFPLLALLVFPLYMILGFGCLVLFVICMIKAYGGQMWRIPVIGDFAARQAGV